MSDGQTKSTQGTQGTRQASAPPPEPGPQPQPGFEGGPAPAADTNYQHPTPVGSRVTEPGAGVVEPGFGAAGGRPGQGGDSGCAPLMAPGAKRAATAYAPAGGPVGPEPHGVNDPDIDAPNFSAAHRHHGPDGNPGKTEFVANDAGRVRQRRGDRSAREVREVMTPDVEVCTAETTLYYVARMMADRDVGAVPVVQSTDTMKPVGIITDRDIVVRVIAKNQDPYALTAGDAMSTGLLTVKPETPLAECVWEMERRQLRRAVVVDAAGRCCGIVAQADVARAAPQAEAAALVRDVSEPAGGGDDRVTRACPEIAEG